MKLTSAGLSMSVAPFAGLPTFIPHIEEDGAFRGGVYKVEQTLFRGPEGGARVHLWLKPDPRMHNHPWSSITCHLLRGWYEAEEIRPIWGSIVPADAQPIRVRMMRSSHPHLLLHQDYHRVVQVEPGTISLMEFGPEVGDGKQWSNLELIEGVWTKTRTTPPAFLDALRHLNPRVRPADWRDPYESLPIPTVQDLLDGI